MVGRNEAKLHPACAIRCLRRPALQSLISATPLQLKLAEKQFPEALRLATSFKHGTVTASLILRKLSAYQRQNGLALALRELGRIERTIFTLKWLQEPALRRRVSAGLNKGEARNALARAIFSPPRRDPRSVA